jgi:hypothetical protein
MKLKHSFLIACLTAAPVWAQQAEEKAEVKKAENAGASSGAASSSASTHGDDIRRTETRSVESRSNRPAPQPEQKPVAYLGVLTREVPPELRSQFSLAEGFGLMVDEVMPDSPAKTAGLKTHDILVKFEDQQLVNMEQLMSLVRSKKKGDTVNLVVITGGKETTVPVTVGERMVAANDQRQPHGYGVLSQNGMHFYNPQTFRGGDLRSFQNQSREFNEQMERFQKEMREYQERLQNWTRNGNKGPMPQPPMLNTPGQQPRRGDRGEALPNPTGISGPGQNNVQNFSEFHAATNVTRRDDSGEYSIQREDGKTTFIARPNNGKEQSWPVNNDEERKAVPEEFRDKLRMMDGAGNTLRIQINPGPNSGGEPFQPTPGGANQPQPTRTKPTTSA